MNFCKRDAVNPGRLSRDESHWPDESMEERQAVPCQYGKLDHFCRVIKAGCLGVQEYDGWSAKLALFHGTP